MFLLVLFVSVAFGQLGANLGISKSGPDEMFIGYDKEDYQYQINIASAGPGLATNVQVVDPVPDYFNVKSYFGQYSSGIVLCEKENNTISCTIPELYPGTVAYVFVNVSLASNLQPFVANNTACVTANEPDPSPTNNCNSKISNVTIIADIETDLLGPGFNAIAGQNDKLAVNVTVHNAGFADATNVKSCFNVSQDLDYNSFVIKTGPGSCAYLPLTKQVCCDFGTMITGATVEYQVVVSVPSDADPGVFFLGACSYSDVLDLDLSDNCAYQTLNVSVIADLSVTKGALPLVVAGQGSTVLFTLVVDNAGPSLGRIVELSDVIPYPFVLQSATIECNTSGGKKKMARNELLHSAMQRIGPACQDVTLYCSVNQGVANRLYCNATQLTTKSRLLILVTVDVPANSFPMNGVFPWFVNNTAFVTGRTPDNDLDHNKDTIQVQIILNSDVGVDKNGPTGNVQANSAVTQYYNFTVTNWGPSVAWGVKLDDVIPSTLIVTGVPEVVTGSATCNTAISNTISCDLGNMTAGAVVFIKVPFIVPSTLENQVEVNNTVFVSLKYPWEDEYQPNNTDSHVFTAVPAPDVKIQKNAPEFIYLDSQMVYYYVLTVENLGPSAATGVTVTDQVPGEFIVQAGTNTTKGSCNNSGNNVTCDLGTLDYPSSPVIIMIPIKVAVGAQAGTYANTAYVHVTGPERNPGNNNSTDTTTLALRNSIFTIRKTGPDNVCAGGPTFNFTVEIENTGPTDAQDVRITDNVPPELTPDLTKAIQTSVGACDWDGQVMKCSFGNVTVGQKIVVTYFVYVKPDQTATTVQNRVDLTTTTPSSSANFDTHTTAICNDAPLRVFKSGPVTVIAGNTVPYQYEITVTNTGVSTAKNVVVSDPIPENIWAVGVTPSPPCSISGAFGSQTVTCSYGNINPGDSRQFTINFVVSAENRVLFANNCATATSDGSTAVGCNMTTILVQADLGIFKSGPPEICAGSSGEFAIDVYNSGPARSYDVVVLDHLDSRYRPGSNSDIRISGNTSNVMCEFQGQVLRCDVASMNVTEHFRVAYPFSVLSNTTVASRVPNRANVSATTEDNNQQFQESTHYTDIINCVDLATTKQAPPSIIAGGSGDFWVFTIENKGVSDAYNAYAVDFYPPSFTPASLLDITVEGPGSCSYVQAENVATPGQSFTGTALYCQWSKIPAGTKYAVTFPFTVGPGVSPAGYDNCVGVYNPSADQVNNKGDDFTCNRTVVQATNTFTIKKDSSSECIEAGNMAGSTFVITLHNNGPSKAYNVILSDTIPSILRQLDSPPVTVPGCTYVSGVLSCTLGDLDPATSTQVTVTLPFYVPQDQLPTEVTNTATVQSTYSATFTATAQVTTCTVADLQITKFAPNNGLVGAGDGVTYTYRLFVKNEGPSDAQSVKVQDTDIPANVFSVSSVVSDAGALCEYPIVSGFYHIKCEYNPKMVAGAEDNIYVNFTVFAGAVGTVENCANISSASTQDDKPPNFSCASSTIVRESDIYVTKEGPHTVVAGKASDDYKYVITVFNIGSATAFPVELHDLDIPFTVRSFEVSQGSCTLASSKRSINCTLGSIGGGQSATLTLFFDVDPDARVGEVCNEACATTSTPEVTFTNNCGKTCANVTCETMLEIYKFDNQTQIIAGDPQQFLFQIKVINRGPSVSFGTNLLDDWPAEYINRVVHAPSQGVCVDGGTGFSCNLGDIAVNQEVIVTVSYRVASWALGEVENRAKVQNLCLFEEWVIDKNNIIASADLFVVKDDCVEQVCVGDEGYVFTVSITNKGFSDAREVNVTDLWPYQYTQGSPIVFNPEPRECTGIGSAFTCFWTKLEAGQTITILIPYTVNTASPHITNCISAFSETPDPNHRDNEDCDTNTPCESADLAVTKSLDNTDCVVAGTEDVRTYIVRVENLGPATSLNVTVVEYLPEGLEIKSAPPGCTNVGNNYTCVIGDMDKGDTAELRWTFKVPPNTVPGIVENRVTVFSPITPDPELCNNNATLCSLICAVSDLSVTKNDGVTVVTAGENRTFVYTIAAHNAGPSDAYNVKIVDIWPTEWERVEVIAPNAQIEYIDSGFVVTVPVLPAGDTYVVFVKYRVPPCVKACEVCNGVRISSNNPDPDETNNYAKDCNKVRTEADLEVCKSDGVTTVVAGDTTILTYTIQVGNNGPSCADCVNLVDHFPPQVHQIPGSIITTQGICTNTKGQDFSCSLQTMQPGDVITILVSYTVPANASTCSVVNTAIASSVTFDPQLCNNDAQDVNAIIEKSELTIQKTDNEDRLFFNDTQIHTYIITVGNLGPSTARDVVLTDLWPTGFHQFLESVKTTHGVCVGMGMDFTCPLGDLLKGEIATITVKYDVCRPGECGENINFVSVYSPTDSHCREAQDSTLVVGCPKHGGDICINCVKQATSNPNGYCYGAYQNTCKGDTNCEKCIESIIADPSNIDPICYSDENACAVFACLYNNEQACGGFDNEGGACVSPTQERVTCQDRKRAPRLAAPVTTNEIVYRKAEPKKVAAPRTPVGQVLSPRFVQVTVNQVGADEWRVVVKNTLKRGVIVSSLDVQVAMKGGMRGADLTKEGELVKHTTCASVIGRQLQHNWSAVCTVRLAPRDSSRQAKVTVRGTCPAKQGYHPVVATTSF